MTFWSPGNIHLQIRDDLSEYLDGRLQPDRTARLEAHVAQCADCRNELELLRGTVRILRALPEATIPRSFMLRPDQVAEPVQTPFWYGWLPTLRAATAATAALFVLVFGLDVLAVGSGGTALSTDRATLSSQSAEDRAAEGNFGAAPAAAPSLPQATPGREQEVEGLRARDATRADNATPAAGPAPLPTAGSQQAARENAGQTVLRTVEIVLLSIAGVLFAATVALSVRRRLPY